MGTWKKEDEGLPNSIPIWYIQLAPVVLATTTGLTSSILYAKPCRVAIIMHDQSRRNGKKGGGVWGEV